MNKIKKILVSFMALAIVSAMPLSASAAETSTATSSQSETISQTETTSQAEPDKPEAQTSSEESSSPESSDLNYLFSDNTSGNADLIASQEVIADDGKFQFLAVTTRDKDVFYIIIDKMKAEDNVYFLNEVDTYDLQKLMSKNSDNSENSDIEHNTSSNKSESSEEPGEESQSSDETSDNGLTNILLVGGVIVLGVIGFVIFKIKKGGFGKKKEVVVPFDDFEEDEEINEDEESKKG